MKWKVYSLKYKELTGFNPIIGAHHALPTLASTVNGRLNPVGKIGMSYISLFGQSKRFDFELWLTGESESQS